jgi:hypothetical protein
MQVPANTGNAQSMHAETESSEPECERSCCLQTWKRSRQAHSEIAPWQETLMKAQPTCFESVIGRLLQRSETFHSVEQHEPGIE